MIKAKGTIDGVETFVIGLSYNNLRMLKNSLKDDTYIHISGKEHGLSHDIVIIGGPTEAILIEHLPINKDTVIHSENQSKH